MRTPSFFFGTLALWALRRHYRTEIRPYAVRRGFPRADVKQAAHRALDRLFDDSWPEGGSPSPPPSDVV